MSVPEEIAARKNPIITTIEMAFAKVQELLARAPLYVPIVSYNIKPDPTCHCCSIFVHQNKDEDSLVVGRFKYNYVCLSHYPTLPGELSVVPYHHVASIKDLPQESFLENMVIAMALLRKTQEYAHENIRDSSGGNIYTKIL